MFNNNKFFSSIYHYTKDDIEKLYQHNVHTFWGTLILSSLFTSLLWYNNEDPNQHLLIWYVLLNAISAVRLHVSKMPPNVQFQEDESIYTPWVNRYLLLTTAMSAVWGLGGFYFYPMEQIHIASSVVILLLAVLITMGPLILASKFALYAQAILIITPVSIRIFLDSANSIGALSLIAASIINIATIIISAYFLVQILQSLKESKKELQNQIDRDQLTGLANRRAFEKTFRNEWRRATRSRQPLALLMVDVDDFRHYNDLAGHQSGNACLKNIALEIQTVARRPADLSARYEGDVFAVLLPHTDLEGADTVAEKLRTYIQNLRIDFPDNSERHITVSIGFASCLPVRPEDISDETNQDVSYPAMLISTAEYAKQKAKDAGKNRCIGEQCGGKDTLSLELKQKMDNAAARIKKENE